MQTMRLKLTDRRIEKLKFKKTLKGSEPFFPTTKVACSSFLRIRKT